MTQTQVTIFWFIFAMYLAIRLEVVKKKHKKLQEETITLHTTSRDFLIMQTKIIQEQHLIITGEELHVPGFSEEVSKVEGRNIGSLFGESASRGSAEAEHEATARGLRCVYSRKSEKKAVATQESGREA